MTQFLLSPPATATTTPAAPAPKEASGGARLEKAGATTTNKADTSSSGGKSDSTPAPETTESGTSNPFQAILDAMTEAETEAKAQTGSFVPVPKSAGPAEPPLRKGDADLAVPTQSRIMAKVPLTLPQTAGNKPTLPAPGDPSFIGPTRNNTPTPTLSFQSPGALKLTTEQITVPRGEVRSLETPNTTADKKITIPFANPIGPVGLAPIGGSISMEMTSPTLLPPITSVVATPTAQTNLVDASVAATASQQVTTGQANAPSVTHQLVHGIRFASGERSLELQLDPPHLGRVRIEFDFSPDNSVKAVVSAAEPETLTLLRRQAGSFGQELADAGLEGVSIEFADHLAGQAEDDAPLGREANVILDEDVTTDAVTADGKPIHIADDTGLDIRL